VSVKNRKSNNVDPNLKPRILNLVIGLFVHLECTLFPLLDVSVVSVLYNTCINWFMPFNWWFIVKWAIFANDVILNKSILFIMTLLLFFLCYINLLYCEWEMSVTGLWCACYLGYHCTLLWRDNCSYLQILIKTIIRIIKHAVPINIPINQSDLKFTGYGKFRLIYNHGSRCFYISVIHPSFPSDFRDNLWVGLGLDYIFR